MGVEGGGGIWFGEISDGNEGFFSEPFLLCALVPWREFPPYFVGEKSHAKGVDERCDGSLLHSVDDARNTGFDQFFTEIYQQA